MGDLGQKVFEISREGTNWTVPGEESLEVMGDPRDLDYSTEGYWSVYSSSSLSQNTSSNASFTGNKTVETFKRDEDLAKIEMAVLALIFILTVLGNCVVLLGIFFRRQKMSRMYYFILHLSVADLITAFFNVLTQLFWEITYRFQGGNFLCKFVKYTQILGPYSSSYVLVMTAMDRYQAICFPLSNCTWTAKRSKIMLGLAWSISVLCCVPQIFIFSYQLVPMSEPPEYDCWATFPTDWAAKAYVTWYSFTVFIIPLIILVFAYSCITRAIWINFNMKAASRNHDNYERKMTRADSDDGEGHSHYENSQDESVFHRENRFSLHAKPSHSISSTSGGAGTSKAFSNINLYHPSKYVLTAKSSSTSSTSGGGGMESFGTESNKKRYRDSNKITVNSVRTARTSTSSCTTQSSTLSPSLSGRRMSALEDKEGCNEKNKNSLCFTSQKLCASNGLKEDTSSSHQPQQEQHHHDDGDEEQLHLIPKESGKNDSCYISETTKSFCSSLSSDNKKDSDGNGSHAECIKNGSVKFSGASDTCQHGCYGKRCNFCFTTSNNGDQGNRERFALDRTNSMMMASASELNKELNENRYHERQSSPPIINASSANIRDREHNQSQRFSGKSSSRHLFRSRSRFSRKGRGGSINEASKQNSKSSMATYIEHQPRTHSVKGISRAKIKTIKLTVTIICCYIFCSSPFIAAQLWSVYDPYASESSFFKGPTFTILTLLASLNSCVNPYIFLFFNPNLLENCFRGIFRPKFPARRYNNGSPLSRTLSQNKKAQYAVGGTNGGNSAVNIGAYNRNSGTNLRKGGGTRDGSLQSNEGSRKGVAAASHLSPLNSPDTMRSQQQQQIPLGNGFGKSHLLEKLSEKNESISSAVEIMVDSIPPTATLLSPKEEEASAAVNCSTRPDKYSPIDGALERQTKQCRLENLASPKNYGGKSTLIT